MAVIHASPLRLRGVPDRLIKEYVAAAEAAWDDAALQLRGVDSAGWRPAIWLELKHPILAPRTITAMVGREGRFGEVEAKTPAALRAALAKHLKGRLT